MIIRVIKSKFAQAIPKRINIYETGAFQYCYFWIQNTQPTISLVEIFEFVD